MPTALAQQTIYEATLDCQTHLYSSLRAARTGQARPLTTQEDRSQALHLARLQGKVEAAQLGPHGH